MIEPRSAYCYDGTILWLAMLTYEFKTSKCPQTCLYCCKAVTATTPATASQILPACYRWMMLPLPLLQCCCNDVIPPIPPLLFVMALLLPLHAVAMLPNLIRWKFCLCLNGSGATCVQYCVGCCCCYGATALLHCLLWLGTARQYNVIHQQNLEIHLQQVIKLKIAESRLTNLESGETCVLELQIPLSVIKK